MPLKTTSLEACPTIGIDIGRNTFHLMGRTIRGGICPCCHDLTK